MKKRLIIFSLIIYPWIILAQTNDTYDIYSQIIKKDFSKSFKLIAIEMSTPTGFGDIKDLDYAFFKQKLKNLKKETFDYFRTYNEKADTINNYFGNNIDVLILAKDTIDSIFFEKNSSWEAFYNKYGQTQGLLSFSKIGFDKEHNQALLYYVNQSDWLEGDGYFILFEKRNGKWLEEGSFMAWISYMYK
jgi:hypothetical protein